MNDDKIKTDRPMNRKELSSYLLARYGIRRSPKTLAKLAVVGGGPSFQKCGRIPLYNPLDADEWVAEMMTTKVRTTSELR